MSARLPRPARRAWAAAGLLAACLAPAWGQGIYTCVDAQGRRLTSDRPIMACLDREQRELSRTGSTKRVHGPTLTAVEQQAQEAREKAEALQRSQARNQQRLDQALLARYPNRAAHDAGREQALAVPQQIINAAEKSLDNLGKERQRLQQELAFYEGDPAKAPAQVRRALTNNETATRSQEKAIADQRAEQARLNARFDDELKRLQALWEAAHPSGH